MSTQYPTSPAPHVASSNHVARVMQLVLIALAPAGLAKVWFFGSGWLVHLIVATAIGLAIEALALHLRKVPLRPHMTDLSVIVTAALFTLPLPPLLPWWAAGTGMAFAIAITKHSYGGLGFNLFNPAMAGYALLLIAFPVEMSHWTAPDASLGSLVDTLATIFTGALPAQQHWDAITMATPFDAMKSGLQSGAMMEEIVRGPAFDTLSGKGWQWISIGALIGGIWLSRVGVIRWHIPIAMLTTIALLAIATNADDPGANGGILFHLLNGGTMLGAFFIATDPVSAATSTPGRLIYGAGIGFLTFVIRKWGNYPDGVAFAVLLMNLCAPLIDRYTVPRIYGHRLRQPAP